MVRGRIGASSSAPGARATALATTLALAALSLATAGCAVGGEACGSMPCLDGPQPPAILNGETGYWTATLPDDETVATLSFSLAATPGSDTSGTGQGLFLDRNASFPPMTNCMTEYYADGLLALSNIVTQVSSEASSEASPGASSGASSKPTSFTADGLFSFGTQKVTFTLQDGAPAFVNGLQPAVFGWAQGSGPADLTVQSFAFQGAHCTE